MADPLGEGNVCHERQTVAMSYLGYLGDIGNGEPWVAERLAEDQLGLVGDGCLHFFCIIDVYKCSGDAEAG